MTWPRCRLLVAGGGVAGVCAAVAAARSGVDTLLVEREEYLGGTGYAGLLRHVCGLYGHAPGGPEDTINPGLAQEIVRLLVRDNPSETVVKMGRVHVLPYRVDDLRRALLELAAAEQRLTLRHNAEVVAVDATGGRVDGVTVAQGGELRRMAVEMAIDCSGDGTLAVLAGAETMLSPPSERQLAGFSAQVSGLSGDTAMLPVLVPYWCAKGVEQGALPALARFTTFCDGYAPGTGLLKLSLDEPAGPDRDGYACDIARNVVEHLRRVLPAFVDAVVDRFSPQVVEREGRRIVGEYLLTEQDLLAGRKFSDAMVKNAWPMELWDRERGPVYRYAPEGDYYEIPRRCIRARGFDNLLTAGRCISVTAAALGSTRVMGTCMALGEQAGLLAAEILGAIR